jgi:REP element-mobilizing transposase RayT
MREQMNHDPIMMSAAMQAVVDATIREVAAHRGWELLVLSVRTNHVHVVVESNDKPEKVMNEFKAWSTRRLREAGLTSPQSPVWSRHGSTRYLWNDCAITEASRYVAESQGAEISDLSIRNTALDETNTKT